MNHMNIQLSGIRKAINNHVSVQDRIIRQMSFDAKPDFIFRALDSKSTKKKKKKKQNNSPLNGLTCEALSMLPFIFFRSPYTLIDCPEDWHLGALWAKTSLCFPLSFGSLLQREAHSRPHVAASPITDSVPCHQVLSPCVSWLHGSQCRLFAPRTHLLLPWLLCSQGMHPPKPAWRSSELAPSNCPCRMARLPPSLRLLQPPVLHQG